MISCPESGGTPRVPEQAYPKEQARRTHAPRLPAPRPGLSRVGNGQVGTDLGQWLFPDEIRANGLGMPAHDKTPTPSEGGCRLVRGAAGPSE
jgi:hypothetical protein